MVTRRETPEDHYVETRRRVLTRYDVDGSFDLLEVDSPPVQIELLESGRGKRVLYLHGLGGTGTDLVPLLPHLWDRFRVVAPTRPGSGLSSKIGYEQRHLRTHGVSVWTAVLDELGIDRIPIVGTSWGGLESVWLALDQPERVERLVLLGGPAGFDRSAPPILRLSGVPWLNRLLHATVARPGPRNTEQLIKTLVANPDRVSDEFKAFATANTTMPGWRRNWSSFLEEALTLRGFRRRYYVGGEAPEVEQPVLFVWGEEDAIAEVDAGRQVADTMPDARFEAIPDAGHLPWIDAPERCAELVTDFLG